jgi:hypothetical protein
MAPPLHHPQTQTHNKASVVHTMPSRRLSSRAHRIWGNLAPSDAPTQTVSLYDFHPIWHGVKGVRFVNRCPKVPNRLLALAGHLHKAAVQVVRLAVLRYVGVCHCIPSFILVIKIFHLQILYLQILHKQNLRI